MGFGIDNNLNQKDVEFPRNRLSSIFIIIIVVCVFPPFVCSIFFWTKITQKSGQLVTSIGSQISPRFNVNKAFRSNVSA